tara:strand:+ start:2187 stop:3113 length:927 start_codon:yes stop_codon:yes gene_type:complete
MKVVSYLKSVPANHSPSMKTELLINFIEGVNASGDTGIVSNNLTIADSEVAVIQGWIYQNISSPHLQLRNKIIQTQFAANRYTVSADANLFLYNDKTNPHGYLRYSFNGIFPTTGIYCDTIVDTSRWQQISKDTNIKLENIKQTGQTILVLLQRNKGWSMDGKDVLEWTIDTISNIRQHTDRPILIRVHPGDKTSRTYIPILRRSLSKIKNVSISNIGTTLQEDLIDAWAVVNHNSSAAVGPIIQGYHCFLTDPKSSQNAEVSNTDFRLIESPLEFDRQKWLERISMFHWKFSELKDGSCWKHMREFI